MQDFWLSQWTLKPAHPCITSRPQPRDRAGFCSVSRDHAMASPRDLWGPQVQVESRVKGGFTPLPYTHVVLWALGLGDAGSKGLGSCSWGTAWGCDGASYVAVAPCRHCPGGVTHQFARRLGRAGHCANTTCMLRVHLISIRHTVEQRSCAYLHIHKFF